MNGVLSRASLWLAAAVAVAALGEARGAAPAWVETSGRVSDYAPDRYFTGFGVSSTDKSLSAPDRIAYARRMAAGNLAQMMQVSISSDQRMSQMSTIARGNEQLVDEFKSLVTAHSELRLDGLEFIDYAGRPSDPAYALAYLDKARAREHYQQRLRSRLQVMRELNTRAGEQLAAKNVDAARQTYLDCDKVITELEEIILILELLNPASPVAEQDIKSIVDAKVGSQQVWSKVAESMDEAAGQLAMKLALQKPPPGKVQVNALSFGESAQYSQFSGRLRGILENHLRERAALTPLMVNELDFTPKSESVNRSRLAANGADYLLSGTYEVKPNEIVIYARVSKVATREIVASASTRMAKSAAGDLELQPRNFLDALQDQRVFSKDEIVGGGLNLEVWTNLGADGLAIDEGSEIKVFVRANQPCYVRFIYHLCNGARIIPASLLTNYPIPENLVNRVVELPVSFEVCAPFGSETMQFFASTGEFPDVGVVKRTFEGEDYDVVADTLAQSNVKHRGIRVVKKAVEVTERRIQLTTIKK